MVEIIKPGRGFIAEVTCNGAGNSSTGCGALLGVNREDLRYYAGGGIMDRDPAVTVRCPACGTMTDLPRKAWPDNARDLKAFTANFAKGLPEPEGEK